MQSKIRKPSKGSLASLLSSAVKAHNSGDLDRALLLYKQTLAAYPNSLDALSNIGVVYKQLGDFVAASAIYKRGIQLNPKFAPVRANYGNLLRIQGEFLEALEQLSVAVSLDPTNHNAAVTLGLTLADLGRYDEAIGCFEQLLHSGAVLDQCYNNLGNIYYAKGDYERAATHYSEAIKINNSFADAHSNLGTAKKELGRYSEAVGHYSVAISLRPDFAIYYFNRGNVYEALSDWKSAEVDYEKSLALDPKQPGALNNLAGLYRKLKRYDEALDAYNAAISLYPSDAKLHNNKGAVLFDIKKIKESIDCYQSAIDLDPRYAEAYNNLGVSLKNQNNFERAEVVFERASELNPLYADPYVNLANLYQAIGNFPRAAASISKALQVDPENTTAIWFNALSKIYPTVDETYRFTDELESEAIAALSEVRSRFSKLLPNRYVNAIASTTPFYLAYYERNNTRFLRAYGDVTTNLLETWRSQLSSNIAQTGKSKEKIRLGLFTHHVYDHSVWNALTQGIVKNLDRTKFELVLFYPEPESDHKTREAAALCDRFVAKLQNLDYWYEDISSEGCDVLLYMDIGMRTLSTQLAGLRIAPLQLATWGHPESTGLPTIDYYVSAEAFEPRDKAADAYTEKLIALPGIGCTYEPLVQLSEMRSDPYFEFGTLKRVLNPGTPFKYPPKNDEIYLDLIARAVDFEFVYFKNDQAQGLSDAFENRLRRKAALRPGELNQRIRFLGWQSREAYFELMRQSALILDTIGFSGFNTVMQAIEVGTPYLAWEGRFMRGRLASGVMQELELTEMIARNPQEFTEKALDILYNAPHRASCVRKICERRNVLFNNKLPVRHLENFIIDKLR